MGREVRRVPANWEHPKDEKGHLIPLHESFTYNEEEIREGLRKGWLKDDPPNYGCNVAPDWSEAERTHYQMYESVTEGTPISPVCDSPEALAQWLFDNGGNAGAGRTATYEQWLSMIVSGGYAPSFVITPETGVVSGVESFAGNE